MSKRDKEPAKPLHYLQQWRDFKKMTQVQLANAVAPPTTAGVISLIEGYNRKLSDKWARRLAAALKIKPGWLLDYDPNTLDGRVLETWGQIPEHKKEDAINMLEALAKKVNRSK